MPGNVSFNSLWQVDLAHFKKHDDMKYGFFCVDVYTLFIMGFAIPNKEGPTIQDCFEKCFKQHGIPEKLECDKG